MAQNKQKIGWIGMGRMGYPMAERLLKAGYDVSIWNRTRAKAEPLAKIGGKVVDKLVRPRRRRRGVLDRLDRQGPRAGLFRQGRRHRPRRQDAEDLRRLLDHRGRGVGRDPRPAQAARRRLRRRAGQRQRQGDQGRQALGGALRPRGRLQDGRRR